MGIGHRISEFLRETPPDRRLEALYKPLQPQDPESNRSQCPGARGLHSQLSEQELLHAAISASKVPTGGNLSCPSNTSMRKVIHDEKGERERNEGEHAIKLILMTLIRRFGSTANDSIKRMTLGLFCHHLGSCPPPLPLYLESAGNDHRVGRWAARQGWRPTPQRSKPSFYPLAPDHPRSGLLVGSYREGNKSHHDFVIRRQG